jgi:hypothetical protein
VPTQVGVGEVRKLAGTLMREGLPGNAGILVTLSDFTEAAIAEAAEVGIELVDNRELVRRLERVGATGLVRRTEDARAAYPCPRCATPMILDRSAHGWWLRCPRYYEQRCRGEHNLDPDSRRALELLLASR